MQLAWLEEHEGEWTCFNTASGNRVHATTKEIYDMAREYRFNTASGNRVHATVSLWIDEGWYDVFQYRKR